MEHCAGGSVGDLISVKGGGLEEGQIAYVCAEALKVRALSAQKARSRE
jgi:hypothetical protein